MKKLDGSAQQGDILARVIETMSLEMDFEKIYQYATSITMEVVGADFCALALPVEGEPLRFIYFWGFPDTQDTCQLPPITPGTLNAFKSGQPVFVRDYAAYAGALPDFIRLGVKTGFAAPLHLGSQVIGVLTMAWKSDVEKPCAAHIHLIEAVLRQVAFAYQRETLIKALSRSQQETEQTNRQLQRVLAISPAMIYNMTYDPTQSENGLTTLYLSNNLSDILGYPRDYLHDNPNAWYVMVHPDDLEHIKVENNPEALQKGEFERIYRIRHQQGHYVWIHDRLRLFPLGQRYEVIGAMIDITARKQAEAELRLHRDHLQRLVEERTADLNQAKEAAEKASQEAKQAEQHVRQMALHDALTGLPNRVLLLERLNQAINQSKRSGKKLALLFIDLDRFKNINDSLGHFVGDQLLCEVSKRFLHCVRDTDTVSRQGGDEFVILLPEVQERQRVIEIAEKLLSVVSQPYTLENYEMRVTHSIGISLFPDDGKDADELMRKADTAMYRAKEVGRNNYQFFTDEIARTTLSRMSLEVDLRRAIEAQEFEVYYQPQIRLATGQMVGVEALLRWNHPQLGILLPNQFIALAEDTGLISWLGHWVIETAIHQIAAWNKAHGINLPIAINLSAVQLEHKEFIQNLHTILTTHQVDSKYLKFELTESMLMQNTENIIAQLLQLKALGIELTLDDFGTHYSSLTYLKRFPVSSLKIDRSFIQHITTDPDDEIISRAIISLGHSLNMRVVAEGVETREQLSLLEALNCDEAQGNYFGLPVPASALDTLLQQTTFPLAQTSFNTLLRTGTEQ